MSLAQGTTVVTEVLVEALQQQPEEQAGSLCRCLRCLFEHSLSKSSTVKKAKLSKTPQASTWRPSLQLLPHRQSRGRRHRGPLSWQQGQRQHQQHQQQQRQQQKQQQLQQKEQQQLERKPGDSLPALLQSSPLSPVSLAFVFSRSQMHQPTMQPLGLYPSMRRPVDFEADESLWVSRSASACRQQQRQYGHYTPAPPCPPTVTVPLKTNFFDPWELSPLPGDTRGILEDKPKQFKSVFDRLTDSAFYTGVHRERFDELGNGRGLAGREYLYAHDGMTESPSRTHEVYSSVVKKPRRALVAPGTLGVQRFGLQTSPPRLVWVFRNGDKHHDGSPFFVKAHIRTLEALYQELTKVVTPIAGPVRRLFDQKLRAVVDVADLVDGAKYLCTSGKLFPLLLAAVSSCCELPLPHVSRAAAAPSSFSSL
ncbi:hypothetical protein Esti_004594 [Eimeria stiedai]